MRRSLRRGFPPPHAVIFPNVLFPDTLFPNAFGRAGSDDIYAVLQGVDIARSHASPPGIFHHATVIRTHDVHMRGLVDPNLELRAQNGDHR